MNKYFYSTDGSTTIGPVSIDQLDQLHQSGKISDFALYAQEDGDESNSYSSWSPAISLTGRSNQTGASDRPCPAQIDILCRYLGAVVAANPTDPLKFEATWLVFVGADYFSLKPISRKFPIHYSLRSILSMREWPIIVPYAIFRPVDLTLKQGTLSKLFAKKIEDRPPEVAQVRLTTPLAIEIYHNVIYSGSGGVGVGIGVAFPIG